MISVQCLLEPTIGSCHNPGGLKVANATLQAATAHDNNAKIEEQQVAIEQGKYQLALVKAENDELTGKLSATEECVAELKDALKTAEFNLQLEQAKTILMLVFVIWSEQALFG